MRTVKYTLQAMLAAALLLEMAAAGAAEPSAAAAGKENANALVIVNGKTITPELYSVFRRSRQESQPTGGDAAGSQLAILNELVNFILLSQDAEKRRIDRNPLVAVRLDLTRTRVLANAAIADYLARHTVPEEQLKKAYDERFKGVPLIEYRVRHILRDSEAGAQALLQELQQGSDFETLMKRYEADGNAGDLGWMSPGQMEPAIQSAVSGLQPGQYAGEPVQTGFGWHVVQLLEKRQIPQPSYGEMRASLLQEQQQAQLTAYIRELRRNAELEVNSPDTRGKPTQGN